jgi:hypothetical protein
MKQLYCISLIPTSTCIFHFSHETCWKNCHWVIGVKYTPDSSAWIHFWDHATRALWCCNYQLLFPNNLDNMLSRTLHLL